MGHKEIWKGIGDMIHWRGRSRRAALEAETFITEWTLLLRAGGAASPPIADQKQTLRRQTAFTALFYSAVSPCFKSTLGCLLFRLIENEWRQHFISASAFCFHVLKCRGESFSRFTTSSGVGPDGSVRTSRCSFS